MSDCILSTIKPSEVDGYCRTTRQGIQWTAHRLAYVEAYGPIPDGLHVRHKCDVRNCVNPEHLELGTHADNMRDMSERGRASRAGGVPHNRTPDPKIGLVRSDYEAGRGTVRSLAAKYKVSPTTVHRWVAKR